MKTPFTQQVDNRPSLIEAPFRTVRAEEPHDRSEFVAVVRLPTAYSLGEAERWLAPALTDEVRRG